LVRYRESNLFEKSPGKRKASQDSIAEHAEVTSVVFGQLMVSMKTRLRRLSL